MLVKIALKIVFWTLYHIFYFEVLHDRGEKLRLTKTRSDILQEKKKKTDIQKEKKTDILNDLKKKADREIKGRNLRDHRSLPPYIQS